MANLLKLIRLGFSRDFQDFFSRWPKGFKILYILLLLAVGLTGIFALGFMVTSLLFFH